MLSRRDVLVGGLALPALAAGAASYPSRPIKMIVPYPPGGADVMARLLADRLAAALGQPVIVENRGGGGGGTVGTKVVATAEPDGHTLLFTSPGPLTTSAAVYKNLDYDPIISPNRWGRVPCPTDAKLILPGLALAYGSARLPAPRP
jgi:tripartite-type tricarboxylate transporter receptor subunit TctC